ncbi:hypothetical protein DUNSADRAFT_5270 [Dunaliella salina]|uniref:Uncharacterized protein n=1 Tax=Dunaliella salina TaxID=3046 RepID=A0ABQ7GQK0_DUNSA|nr:hypothetical protein DUNSADRAFT_5270 [Dunaliella salina]|eukprot:KAF5836878.1 hypothetical protein DUNSADRAFT_5270 [Dunaliella salina]
MGQVFRQLIGKLFVFQKHPKVRGICWAERSYQESSGGCPGFQQ